MDRRICEVLTDDNSVWIMYDSEGRDPYFKKFVTNKNVAASVAIISKGTVDLIVHTLDADNFHNFTGNICVYKDRQNMINHIKDILKYLNYPKNIYLNYSNTSDFQTDVLGHGTFMFLCDIIREIYCEKSSEIKFCSADNMIYSLVESKTDDDIFYMKLSAKRALEIIEDSFKEVRIGMTEKEIANLFHEKFKVKPKYFEDYNVVGEDYAWEKRGCPIILVGPNLSKGGHSMAGNQILEPGFTIYCDFGVTLEINNGKKYSSDLQRMGYALKDVGKKIPDNVKKVFDTLVEAIGLGINKFKPSVKGYEVDKIVRDNILKNGYPNYNHATGHPIGEQAHDLGTSISPKGSYRSNFELKENGVYTIEPRVQINNGGSIEEMVRVTKNGGESLCELQKELYIIER